MIKLASGQRAGITNIRARYHAIHRKLGIDADSPPVSLLELVDIIICPPEGRASPLGREFRFSGHTLADFPHLADWDDEDIDRFLNWLEEPSQQRQITAARQRVVLDDLPLKVIQFPYPQRLYSSLSHRLAALPMNRASVTQWRSTLRNMQGRGLKPDELFWSGLDIQLADTDPQRILSKQELIESIDFSAIRLEITNELVAGGSCELNFEEVMQPISPATLREKGYSLVSTEQPQIRYRDPAYHYRIGQLMETSRWFLLDPSGAPLDAHGQRHASWFQTFEDALNAAEAHARRHYLSDQDPASRPCSRYEHKSLCGGSDYREWLVSLPELPESFFGSHYYERNLLLHFRTKQRLDRGGRRLLFIEELQSDWHQAGARLGYTSRWPGTIPVAPYRREWISLALKLMLLHVAEQDLDGIAWADGLIQSMHYRQKSGPVSRIYDQEIPRRLQRLGNPWGAVVEKTSIVTKEPRLHATREAGIWKVEDPAGDFKTRPCLNQQQAIQLRAKHCRTINLDVPLFPVSPAMKQQILELGLPMFGERHERLRCIALNKQQSE